MIFLPVYERDAELAEHRVHGSHRLLAHPYARFGHGGEEDEIELVAQTELLQAVVDVQQEFETRAASHRAAVLRVAAEADGDGPVPLAIRPSSRSLDSRLSSGAPQMESTCSLPLWGILWAPERHYEVVEVVAQSRILEREAPVRRADAHHPVDGELNPWARRSRRGLSARARTISRPLGSIWRAGRRRGSRGRRRARPRGSFCGGVWPLLLRRCRHRARSTLHVRSSNSPLHF